MLGFDLRDKDDTIEEMIRIGQIGSDYQQCREILRAIVTKCNIDTVQECSCRNLDSKLSFQERLNCKFCEGLGYIIKFKE